MKIDATSIIDRRRGERGTPGRTRSAIRAQLDPALGIRAVVVFGSVARGDFNVWSDIDVLVVADNLPARRLDRLGAIDPRPGPVQPLAWTQPSSAGS
ncbi:MAG: nucleotidyltransferase domain-containing protein [Nocardioides sp.]